MPEGPEISELRTFSDISGHSWRGPELKGTSRSRSGPDSLLLGVFPVINHHVASVAILDLSTPNGTLSTISNMVERCFPSWQGANVIEGGPVPSGPHLGAAGTPALLSVSFRPYTKMAYFHFRGGGMKCWTGSCDFAHALFRHGLDLVEIGPTSSWIKDVTRWAGCRGVSGRREETICSLFGWSGLGHQTGHNQELSPCPPMTVSLP